MRALYLALTFLFSLSAHAELKFEDATFPEILPSARALGMGNAYMNKVDDSWSAFYNPAGLGTVRGLQFHLTNLYLETNNGYLDITGGQGSIFDSTGNYAKAYDAEGLRDLLADTPGRISHARFGFFPNITFRGFTLGWVYSQQNRGRIKSETADYELAERTDSGPLMALNLSLFGGVLKFGVSGMVLTRKQIIKDIPENQPTSIDEDVDYKKGTMTHITAGTRITLPVFLLPTFSVVYRNSAAGKWYDTSLGGAPTDVPQTVDGAFSITPYTGRMSRLHLEVDYRDLGNAYSNVSAKRKVQAGMEFDYMRRYFVRFGYAEGWGSAGIGVRNKKFIFDLTTYAVEADETSSAFRQQEDRRYVLSLASGF